MTLQTRIIELLDEKGCTRAELSRAADCSRATVTDWANGKTSDITGKYLINTAAFFGVTELWLAAGKGPKYRGLVREDHGSYGNNTSSGPELRGVIPLISKVQAGDWGEAIDNLAPGEAEDYFPTIRKHSKTTYALRVEGDSMWSGSPTGPSYSDGDIIIVDPEQRFGATTGSRVIARLLDSSIPMDRRVTFKQLIIDGPHSYLKPLNRSYTAIHEPFEVIGLVLHGIRPE